MYGEVKLLVNKENGEACAMKEVNLDSHPEAEEVLTVTSLPVRNIERDLLRVEIPEKEPIFWPNVNLYVDSLYILDAALKSAIYKINTPGD